MRDATASPIENAAPVCSILSRNKICLCSTSSLQSEIASGCFQIRASIQASRCIRIAVSPDVAVAQMVVPSAPTWSAKTPYVLDALGFIFGIRAISVARFPYTLVRSRTEGIADSNRALNFRAIIRSGPSSALSFRFRTGILQCLCTPLAVRI